MRLWTSILLFLLVFISHARSPVTTSFDSMWAIYTAHSLIHEKNINLDEFKPQLHAKKNFGIRKKGGHYYNYFPLGASFLSVPFVFVYELAPSLWIKILPGLVYDEGKVSSPPTALDLHLSLERIIASFVVALTSIVIFFIALNFISVPYSLILSLMFAFCTPAWSTASRALWQHGPSMLLLTLAILIVVRSWKNSSHIAFAAIPLALSFVVRPTNSVSIAVFTLYVFFTAREYFIRFSLIGFLTISPFVLGSLEVFGKIMPSYFKAGRIGWHSDIFEAYLANLFSASRGIFVFSPFLIMGPIVLYRYWQSNKENFFFATIFIAILLHTLAVSAFPAWWGGHCYGPRYMSEMGAYLIILLIPFLKVITNFPQIIQIRITVGISLLCLWSFWVHYQGAMRPALMGWNVIPNNIDYYPERVWDWRDPQYFR
jgi:hypothetical protein